MKRSNYIWMAVAGLLCLASCNDASWDDHYYVSETPVSNDQLQMVAEPSETYLAEQEDLHDMYTFLAENGVFETLAEKGQLYTLLVVDNEAFKQPEAGTEQYLAKSHVTDISLSPSNLYDGERILMWHGKFVTVGVDSLGLLGQVDHITFNGSPVQRVVKTDDGYIYVLDSMIVTPASLYDYIQELPDEYSVFREMILASGGKEFDKANSKPIGVDATGNTIYDTTWIYTNEFFDAKNFSLSSESLTATMLLFSNDVISDAMHRADSMLNAWGMERDFDVLNKWVLEVAFFSKKYTAENLAEATSIKSIYDRQWVLAQQEMDIENAVSVSNGIIYPVTRLTIPTSMLIYRIKDYYYHYESCSADEKTLYFDYTNLKNLETKTEVTGWTPLSGVWPLHENKTLSCYCDDASSGYSLRMQLIHPVTDEAGNVLQMAPYNIPPGNYRFAMGFAQNQNVTYTVSVYAKLDSGLKKIGESSIIVGSTTEFHYDRGTFLSDTWPEGYKEVKDVDEVISTNSKRNNYDTDGGCVIESLEVPDEYGDGTALPLVILLENNIGTSTRLVFHHWCLRPISSTN